MVGPVELVPPLEAARERVAPEPCGARRGEELDEGDPEQLAADYVSLRSRLPQLRVLGGCCGTDHRHIEAMSRAWLAEEQVSG